MAFLRSVSRASARRKYGLLFDQLCRLQEPRLDVVTRLAALKSTAAVVQEATAVPGKRKDPLDITFEDAKAAFKSKTNLELIRAYLVYTMCSFETLVENNMQVLGFSIRFFAVIWRRSIRRGLGDDFSGFRYVTEAGTVTRSAGTCRWRNSGWRWVCFGGFGPSEAVFRGWGDFRGARLAAVRATADYRFFASSRRRPYYAIFLESRRPVLDIDGWSANFTDARDWWVARKNAFFG